jgi:hypothetical protein
MVHALDRAATVIGVPVQPSEHNYCEQTEVPSHRNPTNSLIKELGRDIQLFQKFSVAINPKVYRYSHKQLANGPYPEQ